MGYLASGRPRGRPKQFNRYELPHGVVKIVSAQCADFSRREKAIREGSLPDEILAAYIQVNDAISKALSDIEEICREGFLQDIAENRGYEKSNLGMIFSSRAYYNRKRKAIYEIAKRLKLI